MSKKAHILALAVRSLWTLSDGPITHDANIVARILDKGEVWAGPRPWLEGDRGFRQLIPYVVLRDGDKILAYTRGGAGTETRLHALSSVGFGGHVDLADAIIDEDGAVDLRSTLEAACVRELEEELGVDLSHLLRISALFNWHSVITSSASDVDRVHIGFVAMVDVKDLPPILQAGFENTIENPRWREAWAHLAEHTAGEIRLETWSELVLTSIINS